MIEIYNTCVNNIEIGLHLPRSHHAQGALPYRDIKCCIGKTALEKYENIRILLY